VHFAGCTTHPNKAWVTQQACQMLWTLEGREPGIRFLIRDNDQKFSQAFGAIFHSEGMKVIPTPYGAEMTSEVIVPFIARLQTR
jgi:hypothetical protein